MSELRTDQEPHEPKTGREFHVLSEQAREKGNVGVALGLIEKAIPLYSQEGNSAGESEAYASKFLSLNRLFRQTHEETYAKQAEEAARKSVDIARHAGIKVGLAIPLYNLGKMYEQNGQLEDSIQTMKEAITAFDDAPEDPQGLSSVKAEMRTRIAALEFRLGDDAALDRFDLALEDLKTNPHPDLHAQRVWVSGAYLNLGEAYLVRGNRGAAREQANKVKEIIGLDPEDLKLRADDLATFEQRLAA